MRLVTFRHETHERIGVQIESHILDLSRVSPGIPMDMKAFLSQGESIVAQTHEMLTHVKEAWLLAESDVTLLAPIPRPGKILCIGHNYQGHMVSEKQNCPIFQIYFARPSTRPQHITSPSSFHPSQHKWTLKRS